MLPLPEIDANAAARVNDAWLQGTWANAKDREVAALLEKISPGSGQLILKGRKYHRHAARVAAAMGARGILFASSRLPTRKELLPHLDDLARALPGRFVFANSTQEGRAINEAVLAHPRVSVVLGSARTPCKLMRLPEVTAIGPLLQVQLQFAPHFWPPELAARLIAEYAELLQPGSSLMLTTGCALPAARERAQHVVETLGRHTGPVYCHEPEDIAGWIDATGKLEIIDTTIMTAGDPRCAGLMTGIIAVRRSAP